MRDMKNQKKLNKIKARIVPTLKENGVVRASIFGSFARGEESKKSDLDILVKFRGSKSLLDLIGLELDLEDKLKREVDLLTYGSINHLIKERVLKEQVRIL